LTVLQQQCLVLGLLLVLLQLAAAQQQQVADELVLVY
jgi:hypothetical protein